MFLQDYELSEEEKVLLQKVLDGDVALRKIEEFADPVTSVKIRRLAIQEFTKLEFENIQNFPLMLKQHRKRTLKT